VKKAERLIRMRIPNLVYDRYCQCSQRTGRTVQHVISLALSPRRQRGRPKAPSTVIDVKLPAAVYRRYRKRARREGKSLDTLLRELLTRRAGGGISVG
jgi:predicted DNA-binding protein